MFDTGSWEQQEAAYLWSGRYFLFNSGILIFGEYYLNLLNFNQQKVPGHKKVLFLLKILKMWVTVVST